MPKKSSKKGAKKKDANPDGDADEGGRDTFMNGAPHPAARALSLLCACLHDEGEP